MGGQVFDTAPVSEYSIGRHRRISPLSLLNCIAAKCGIPHLNIRLFEFDFEYSRLGCPELPYNYITACLVTKDELLGRLLKSVVVTGYLIVQPAYELTLELPLACVRHEGSRSLRRTDLSASSG